MRKLLRQLTAPRCPHPHLPTRRELRVLILMKIINRSESLVLSAPGAELIAQVFGDDQRFELNFPLGLHTVDLPHR